MSLLFLVTKPFERKPMHHRRDWSNYNRELVNRGKINFWISPQLLETWKAKKQKKNGRSFIYGEELIKTMCFIRFKFHLSLRETEGFFLSLTALLVYMSKVPCYTQICRRMKTISLPSELLQKRNVTDIVLDTTGLKVYGAGEWRAKKYKSKRRWKKLHLGMDLESGKLILAEITNEYVHDTQYLEKALKKANRRKGKVLFDGIADSKRCYQMAQKYNKLLLTPPKTGAVLRKESGYEKRNEAIQIIQGLGGDKQAKSIWSKLIGYNKRVMVESMVSRWKQLFGGSLKSHCERRRKVEVQLKAQMINRVIESYSFSHAIA
jgi:Transposase DDE domain